MEYTAVCGQWEVIIKIMNASYRPSITLVLSAAIDV